MQHPGALAEVVARERVDVLLLQEHKLQEKDVEPTTALMGLPVGGA